MESLRKEYRDLEIKVLRTLREMVETSNTDSCYIHGNALHLYGKGFDYFEVCLINDKIVLIEGYGLHTFATEIELQTLIEIVESCTL